MNIFLLQVDWRGLAPQIHPISKTRFYGETVHNMISIIHWKADATSNVNQLLFLSFGDIPLTNPARAGLPQNFPFSLSTAVHNRNFTGKIYYFYVRKNTAFTREYYLLFPGKRTNQISLNPLLELGLRPFLEIMCIDNPIVEDRTNFNFYSSNSNLKGFKMLLLWKRSLSLKEDSALMLTFWFGGNNDYLRSSFLIF